MFKKFAALLVFVALICTIAVPTARAANNSEVTVAPLSPEFLKWQKEQQEQKEKALHNKNVSVKSASDSENIEAMPHRTNGYIPSPIDLSHLKDNPPQEIPTVNDPDENRKSVSFTQTTPPDCPKTLMQNMI